MCFHRTLGRNQRDQIVCSFKRTMLIPIEGQAVEDKPDSRY